MFLDDFDVRTVIALGLRLIATERVPTDDGAFDRFRRELADRAADVLRAQGVRAVPPFPGDALPRSAAFAAVLWRDDEEVGTAITALIRGRVPNISVAPPSAVPAAPRPEPPSQGPRE
jgi:hypothetical protein